MKNITGLLEEWESRGSCSAYPTNWFFPERTSSNRGEWFTTAERMAKHVCFECPVRRECLDRVFRWEEITGAPQEGIWGGTLPRERKEAAHLPVQLRIDQLMFMVDAQRDIEQLKEA